MEVETKPDSAAGGASMEDALAAAECDAVVAGAEALAPGQRVAAYVRQMTMGCGDWACRNADGRCVSAGAPPMTAQLAAVRAVRERMVLAVDRLCAVANARDATRRRPASVAALTAALSDELRRADAVRASDDDVRAVLGARLRLWLGVRPMLAARVFASATPEDVAAFYAAFGDRAAAAEARSALWNSYADHLVAAYTSGAFALAAADSDPVQAGAPRLLAAMLLDPLNHDPDQIELFSKILQVVRCAVFPTPDSSGRMVAAVLQLASPAAMRELLNAAQQVLTLTVIEHAGSQLHANNVITSAVAVIGVLDAANNRLPDADRIAVDQFYNESLCDELLANEARQISLDLRRLFARPGAAPQFCFCKHPFVLTAELKSDVLDFENRFSQQRHSQSPSGFMFGPMQMPFLGIRVRRENIIEDTLGALELCDPLDLKKQLRVQFENEDGIDAGGVKKEFFQLIVREIFDPKYGMYKKYDDDRMFWFSPGSEDMREFELIGTILGLSIYNSVILDLHFPRYLFRRLSMHPYDSQSIEPTLDDLAGLDPRLADGLRRLLDYDQPDVEDVFALRFVIVSEEFGAHVEHPLVPGGADIAVTAGNRAQYVQAYVNWILVDSVRRQLDAFVRGFRLTCNTVFFQSFRSSELELLVCGEPTLDFAALRAGARYDNGYSAEHPVIQRFWTVVSALSDDEKRRFLFFCTGSDRSPIGGLSKLHLSIVRNAADLSHLPTSHTCFNVLLLPEYSCVDMMKRQLLLAILHHEGFGMR